MRLPRPRRNSSTTIGTGLAESAAEHHVDGGFRFREVSATTTPLPAASPSALTTIGAPLRAHIALAGSCGKALIGRGWNVVRLAKILVKPLEPSSCAAASARPESLDAGSGEIVHDAGAERRLGSDHHQIDFSARQNAITAPWSATSSATNSHSRAIPALPGAQTSRPRAGSSPSSRPARARARRSQGGGCSWRLPDAGTTRRDVAWRGRLQGSGSCGIMIECGTRRKR